MDPREMNNWKERVHKKYGRGVDRRLFESLRSHDVFALTQARFRWRYDDGGETDATWIDYLNMPVAWLPDTSIRIRTLVEESGAGTAAGSLVSNATGSGGSLQYRKNGGTWTEVTTSSTNVKIVASANITDNDSTTSQLGGAGTFVAGKIKDAGAAYTISIPGDNKTEVEYCIQVVDADTADGDLIELRLVGQDTANTAFSTYTEIPIVRVQSLLTSLTSAVFTNLREGAYLGPYETNSRKYIPVPDANNNIQMLSTTQASPTDGQWAALDKPIYGGSNTIIGVGSEMDSNGKIYVGIQDLDGDIRYARFDTATNKWDTIELVETMGVRTYDTLPTHGNHVVGVCLFGTTPQPGIFYFGHSNSFSIDAVYLAIRSGVNTWTTNGKLSNTLNIAAAAPLGTGSDDRGYVLVHIGSTVRVANFDSTGWVSSPGVTIDSAVDSAEVAVFASRPFTSGGDSGKLLAVWLDASGKISTRIINPASTPGLGSQFLDTSDNTVYGTARTAVPFAVGCASQNGAELHLMYADNTTQDIYRDIFDGSSWGTDTEEVDAVTCNFISCRKGFGNEILYVYLDGTTETFGKFAVTGPSDIPVPLRGIRPNTLLRM